MATFDEIIGDIESYATNWANRRDEIPFAIKAAIVAEITATGSVDTGRFRASIDAREINSGNDGYRYLIDSARDKDVTYEGFLEFGTTRPNAFGVLISKRENFKGGIVNARLQPIADSIADQSFVR